MPNLHKFVYSKIDRPKNYYFPESLQITDSYHYKKQQPMPSRYWAKRTFCWNACSLNKTSDAGCIFYILLLTISLYTYMNYLGTRYKLEQSMFGLISKPLIVLYIICGYLCINKKKRKKLLFFLNLLRFIKEKTNKKSFNLMHCDTSTVYSVIAFEKS